MSKPILCSCHLTHHSKGTWGSIRHSSSSDQEEAIAYQNHQIYHSHCDKSPTSTINARLALNNGHLGQERKTLYLPFWLLHKPFLQSSVTEGCHRARTAAHSVRSAQSRAQSSTVLCKLHRQRVHGRRSRSSACCSESCLAIPKDCWQTLEVLGLHCFSSSFVYEKALRQRSIEERTRDYFYYDYCYYFAQLHRGQNLGTFCKEKFVSLFLWPN